MRSDQATAEVFFTAFKSLKTAERGAFLARVVGDRRLREELMDLALIEEAKLVKGKIVSARDYFTARRCGERKGH